MTDRNEFLYTKKGFNHGFRERWSETTRYTSAPSSSSAGVNTLPAGQPPEEPKKKDVDPPAPAPEPEGPKTGKKGKRGRQDPQEPPQGGDDAEAAEAKRKKRDLDSRLAKTKQVKQRMNVTLAAASDLLGVISTQSAWSWAAHDSMMKGVYTAKSNVEAFKVSSPFFQAWVVQENFSAYVRKHFEPDVVQKHLLLLPQLEGMLDTLELEIQTLKAMHNARPAQK